MHPKPIWEDPMGDTFERSKVMCAEGCALRSPLRPCQVICQHLRWERIDAKQEAERP